MTKTNRRRIVGSSNSSDPRTARLPSGVWPRRLLDIDQLEAGQPAQSTLRAELARLQEDVAATQAQLAKEREWHRDCEAARAEGEARWAEFDAYRRQTADEVPLTAW